VKSQKLDDAESKPKYISARALAARWSISLSHAYDAGDDGLIPIKWFGASRRYALEDVERYEREG